MPFTTEEFFDLFARYNLDLWPWQLVAIAAGLLAVALMYRETRLSAALILAILSAMWLVNGIGYHWLYFSTINPAARLFAAVFVLQGILLALALLLWTDLRCRVSGSAASIFGAVCMVYAIAIYPVLGGGRDTAIRRCRCSVWHPVPQPCLPLASSCRHLGAPRAGWS